MMKNILWTLTLFTALSSAGLAQVNAVITDGNGPFAEGRLKGYFVQARGNTICADPYAIGKYISCSKSITVAGMTWTAPRTTVWVDTNGFLGGMSVVSPSGKVLCESPMVSIEFRGPESYIICED